MVQLTDFICVAGLVNLSLFPWLILEHKNAE